MKHKVFKIHWSTWKAIRHVFPGMTGETMDHYVRRIERRLNNGKN